MQISSQVGNATSTARLGKHGPTTPPTKWFDAIGPHTLIIVDEAGMTPTHDLDVVWAVAQARGASVRLIGDDRQLPPIGAGGVVHDLADHPNTVTLTDVVRFVDQAQGAASLALRVGDPAAIAYYTDHGRIHVGHDETAANMAYRAWAADRAAGRETLMLSPTIELTTQLNQRARLDRLTHDDRQASAASVTLGDGLTASVGDWITTRKNARWLRPTRRGNRYVKNGHRWIVQTVNRDGSLTVSPLRDKTAGWTVTLPADYVQANTTLGYARTINAAQGSTSGNRRVQGNCHFVITGDITLQQFYVGMSRGTGDNHAYGSTSEADPHRIIFQKATHPPTAVEVLEAIMRRD
jgi:ATP-dependent exoDNAse (exonuclease V) alpha subunit